MDSLESDMKLLLDALQYLSDDKDQQIQALKTLANMCNQEKGALYMYKNGGLKSITTIFCNTQSTDVKQWALYGLSNAVQYHKQSKKLLCIPEMMKKIHIILSMKKSSYLVHVAANFIISLASEYAPAQEMARAEKCLHRLLDIFRDSMPRSDVWFDGVGTSSDELWMIVSSALCILMSDPQNETNQSLCAKFLPQAICVLKNSRSNIIFTSLNFIGHCISNNKETQRTLHLVGGLHALVHLLKKYADMDGEKEARVHATVLKTVSYAVTDFLANKEAVGSLSIIPILLNLLQKQNICPGVLLSCLICLSRCIDDCVSNRMTLFKNNGVQKLITILIATEDEKTRKIILFLLRRCLPSLDGKLEISDQELLSKLIQSGSTNFQSEDIASHKKDIASTHQFQFLRDKQNKNIINKIATQGYDLLNRRHSNSNDLTNNLSTFSHKQQISETFKDFQNPQYQLNEQDCYLGVTNLKNHANCNQTIHSRNNLRTPVSKRYYNILTADHQQDSHTFVGTNAKTIGQVDTADELDLENRKHTELLPNLRQIENANQSISASDVQKPLPFSYRNNMKEPSLRQWENTDTRKDDQIMRILNEHGKLLQSVNKRIDGMNFDNLSVMSGNTTEIPLNNFMCRPRESIKHAESGTSTEYTYSDLYSNGKEKAIPDALSLKAACTLGSGVNLTSSYQQSNETLQKKQCVVDEFPFKVPSIKNNILSYRRTPKKIFSRYTGSGSMIPSRNNSLCDVIKNLNDQEVSIKHVIGRSPIKGIDRATALQLSHKGENIQNQSEESWSRNLEYTPKSNIRYPSSERSTKARSTLNCHREENRTRRGSLFPREPEKDSIGADKMFHSDTLRVTITPGTKRKVQQGITARTQSQIMLSKIESNNSEKENCQFNETIINRNKQKKSHIFTNSDSKGSSTPAKSRKHNEDQDNVRHNESISDWVNKTNCHYYIENDDERCDDITIDINQDSLRNEATSYMPNSYKTPMLLNTVDRNVKADSSSTDQHGKTPANFLPSRLAKVGRKVKRVLSFNGDYSASEEDGKDCNEKDQDSVDQDSPKSNCSSIERADSPTILPSECVDERVSNLEKAPQKQSNCLGCYPFSRFPFFVVNSRNFASALQSDDQTCKFHKSLIKETTDKEEKFKLQSDFNPQKFTDSAIGSGKSTVKEKEIETEGTKFNKTEASTFDFMSDSGKDDDLITDLSSLVSYRSPCSEQATTVQSKRRRRKEYSEEEIENILIGVERHGKRWNAILHSFKFKQGRTAADLKDKYKRICGRSRRGQAKSKKVECQPSNRKPFTAQEIVNLKTGYGRYGARWKTILNNFHFENGRSADELRVKFERVLKRF